MTLFWAVLRTPVFPVLCWTVAAPHALRAALDVAATRRLPPQGRLVALGTGVVCTGEDVELGHGCGQRLTPLLLALLNRVLAVALRVPSAGCRSPAVSESTAQPARTNAPSRRPLACPAAAALLVQFPGLLGLLAMLAWAAADLLAAAWAALHSRPELLQQLAGAHSGLAASLQQALDAEGSMDRATLALLRHALPALPALLLGLLLREGAELVSRGRMCTLGRRGCDLVVPCVRCLQQALLSAPVHFISPPLSTPSPFPLNPLHPCSIRNPPLLGSRP